MPQDQSTGYEVFQEGKREGATRKTVRAATTRITAATGSNTTACTATTSTQEVEYVRGTNKTGFI